VLDEYVAVGLVTEMLLGLYLSNGSKFITYIIRHKLLFNEINKLTIAASSMSITLTRRRISLKNKVGIRV